MSSISPCPDSGIQERPRDPRRRSGALRGGRPLALAAVSLAALGLTAAAAPAAMASGPVNYYVAPNGTDTSGSCPANSQANAFPTIQDATACAVSGDVIVLAPTTGDAPYAGIGTISQDVTIIGAGARSTIVDVSTYLLTIAAGADVTVTGVTLTHANPDVFYQQPNVLNEGTLLLSGDMVTANPTQPGIVNEATGSAQANLTVDDSTITGNDNLGASYVGGGGIMQFGPTGSNPTLTVDNSTIAGNQAQGNGGGIWLYPGTATLINSTVADNSSIGGAIGGIYGHIGIYTLSNTIVAGNTSIDGGPAIPSDCGATLTDGSGGSNLIGVGGGAAVRIPCVGLTNGVNGDQVGVTQPGLASAPADNGGPTDTVALLPGSPAIGAGNAPTCESAAIGDVDQRGDSRNALTRDACDIGAYDTGGN